MKPTKEDYRNALQLAELAYLTDMDVAIVRHVKRQYIAGKTVQENHYKAFKLICQHYFSDPE